MSAASQRVNLIVSVDDQHSNQIAEVADRLRSAGMSIDDLLETLGTITGSIESGKVDEISRVQGVAHVETSRHFQLAPPDSEIQ